MQHKCEPKKTGSRDLMNFDTILIQFLHLASNDSIDMILAMRSAEVFLTDLVPSNSLKTPCSLLTRELQDFGYHLASSTSHSVMEDRILRLQKFSRQIWTLTCLTRRQLIWDLCSSRQSTDWREKLFVAFTHPSKPSTSRRVDVPNINGMEPT